MTDELEAPVMGEMPSPRLYDFPRPSRGSDPVPEVWHRAMAEAEKARALFHEKRYDQAADRYLEVAAMLPEEAGIGIYGKELASARAVAYQNAALAFKTGGMSVKGEARLSAIVDAEARDGLVKAIDLLSD